MSRSGEVVAHRVWKRFRPDLRHKRLTAYVQNLPARLRSRRPDWMWALRDVDFAVEPGEAIGLVGANGSGKSTLLKILNRVMYPYAGRVEATGRVGALIEVTQGLHPELTGKENISLYGSLLGLKRRVVAQRFDRIVEFAEIEAAVDRQLKFYSSGMRMRLGFAVAAFLEPDTLLVDEVLAVGDASFQQRCLDRMTEVHAQGTTLVYVSHDLPTVEATCARAIWLHRGVLMRDGPVREVLGDYRRAVEEQVEFSHVEGVVAVAEVTVRGVDNAPPRSTEPLEIALTLSSPMAEGVNVHLGVTEGPGTPIVSVAHSCALAEGQTEVRCRLASLPVPRGAYYLWLAVTGPGGKRQLRPWAPVARFEVTGPELTSTPRGVVRLAPVYVEASWEDGECRRTVRPDAATDR